MARTERRRIVAGMSRIEVGLGLMLISFLMVCALLGAGAPGLAADTRDGVTYYGNEDLRRSKASRTPAVRTAVPRFEVVGQSRHLASILVPRGSTNEEVRELILFLRFARQKNHLKAWLSPTTPGSPYGEYSIVWIFIFSDPGAASIRDVVKFANQNPTPGTEAYRFWSNVRGHFNYTFQSGDAGRPDGRQ